MKTKTPKKRKICVTLAVLMLIASSAMVFMTSPVAAATEDLTGFTENDTPDVITVHNATHATINASRNQNAYLYNDYTAGYFGDFTINGSFRYNGYNSATYSTQNVILVTNGLGARLDMKTAGEAFLSVDTKGDSVVLNYFNASGAGTYDNVDHAIPTGSYLYFSFARASDTATLTIFNDSGHTDQYFELTQTLYSPPSSYRYMQLLTTSNQTGTEWSNVTVADVEIISAGGSDAPTVSSPSPADGATAVSTSTTSWSCSIADPNGDAFDWSIETAPDVGSDSAVGAANGTKTAALTGLSPLTTYTVYVNATDGSATVNETYTFTTGLASGTIPNVGQPVTNFSLVEWNGVDISLYGDTTEGTSNDLFSSSNMAVILEMEVDTDDHHQVGAGSVTRSPTNDTWYTIVRERINDAIRGRGYAAYECSGDPRDPDAWELMWRTDRRDVVDAPGTVNSVERSVVRYYNSSYYWYFCAPVGGTYDWKVYYVTAPTIERLDNQWLDGDNWHQISLDGYYRLKDPWVGYDGSRYILWTGKGESSSSNGYALFTADNPEFNGKTEQWNTGSPDNGNTGCIEYDVVSDSYLMWSGQSNPSDPDWFFRNSSDLSSWSSCETWDMGTDNRSKGNMRYMDYYKVNDSSYLFAMEYDADGRNDSNEWVMWYEGAGELDTNRAPTLNYYTPVDGATGVSTDATLTAIVNDTDGDSVTVTWSACVGPGCEIGSDTVASGNGSASITWSGLDYETSYGYYITLYDGTEYVTYDATGDCTGASTIDFITFTTTDSGNNAPTYSSPLPVDDASGVSVNATLQLTVYDADSDAVTVTFYDAADGSVIGYDTVTNANASVTWSGLSTATTYTWYAILDDGTATTTTPEYRFTTEGSGGNALPVATNAVPADGATGLSTTVTLSLYVTDGDGDAVTVTFRKPDGTPLASMGVSNETASYVWSGLQNGTTYSWYATLDDGTDVIDTRVRSFTTGGTSDNAIPVVSDPSPSDGATEVNTSPTLSLDVTDADGDAVTVSFYDAADDTLIGTDTVTNDTAYTTWDDLDAGANYSWYTVADDGTDSVTSDTWNFTTATSTPPPGPTDIDAFLDDPVAWMEANPGLTAIGIIIVVLLALLIGRKTGDVIQSKRRG